MTKIYTWPDYNFDRSIKKVLIKNADWDDILLTEIVNSLDETDIEIYIQPSKIEDIQWSEGIRAMVNKVIDWRNYKDKDPKIFLKELLNDI